MSELIPWHRLFGLTLVEYFRDLPATVELEKDLSQKKQLLDIAVVVAERDCLPTMRKLPDGLDDLATHNLITFKSFRDALGAWTLEELVSYYVNYRKQVSPSMKDLLPFDDFRLYAVGVRTPEGLMAELPLARLQPGVYEVRSFTRPIRVVVIQELPKVEHNAVLHLFAARMDHVEYGAINYQHRSAEMTTLLRWLFQRYRVEGITVPTGMEQLKELTRQTIKEMFLELSEEERRKLLTPEERLKDLTPEERLKDLTPEERLKDLTAEQRVELARLLQCESPGSGNANPPAK